MYIICTFVFFATVLSHGGDDDDDDGKDDGKSKSSPKPSQKSPKVNWNCVFLS